MVLASGIGFTKGIRNKALIFDHNLKTKKLSWSFTFLKDLWG